MEMCGRRTRLREGTADAHARLDAHVDQAGFFATQSGYRQYLQATWRARGALEPLLDRSGAAAIYPLWPERRLGPLLLEDMNDVGETARARSTAGHQDVLDVASVLGALYVLEGSALGARVIERRVAQIGMTAQFGARHLGRQATRDGAWSHFLQLLETTSLPEGAEDQCVRSALSTFDRFEREYVGTGV